MPSIFSKCHSIKSKCHGCISKCHNKKNQNAKPNSKCHHRKSKCHYRKSKCQNQKFQNAIELKQNASNFSLQNCGILISFLALWFRKLVKFMSVAFWIKMPNFSSFGILRKVCQNAILFFTDILAFCRNFVKMPDYFFLIF